MQPFELHVHVHGDERLDEILRLLRRLTTQENHIMSDLTAITNAVRANTNAVDSVKVFIGELAAKITEAGTDQGALDNLVAELNAKDAELAQAIVANTPAAPNPATPPSDTPPVPAPAPGTDPSTSSTPDPAAPAPGDPASSPPPSV